MPSHTEQASADLELTTIIDAHAISAEQLVVPGLAATARDVQRKRDNGILSKLDELYSTAKAEFRNPWHQLTIEELGHQATAEAFAEG